MRTPAAVIGVLLALAVAPCAHAAPALVELGRFAEPTYAASPPGDASRVFVTERSGQVRLVVDGVERTTPFLDLGAIAQTDYQERGLLSIAFAPDYASSGRFYVDLTVSAAAAVSGTAGEIQVREYRRSAADPNVADPGSARIVLAIRHDQAQNHNGGQLQFGPDGKLWVGVGDGGGSGDPFHHAQDPASLLGKLLELDPAQPSPAPVVVAAGLRNPWRFSFDRADGQLVVGDVGQDAYEEIDVGLAPNYGWPCREGASAYGSDPGCDGVATAAPAIVRPHAGGACSITGGYVVRDPGLPTLLGRYLYGDFCDPDLRSADLARAAATDAPIGLQVSQLSSFGEDACGRILAVSLAGPVYRLVDGAPSPCPPAAPGAPIAAPARCRLSAHVSGLRSVGRRHRIVVALRSDVACAVKVSAKVARVAQFRSARASLAAGRAARISLRLTSHGRRALARALRRRQSLKLALTIQPAVGAAVRRAARIRA